MHWATRSLTIRAQWSGAIFQLDHNSHSRCSCAPVIIMAILQLSSILCSVTVIIKVTFLALQLWIASNINSLMYACTITANQQLSSTQSLRSLPNSFWKFSTLSARSFLWISLNSSTRGCAFVTEHFPWLSSHFITSSAGFSSKHLGRSICQQISFTSLSSRRSATSLMRFLNARFVRSHRLGVAIVYHSTVWRGG